MMDHSVNDSNYLNTKANPSIEDGNAARELAPAIDNPLNNIRDVFTENARVIGDPATARDFALETGLPSYLHEALDEAVRTGSVNVSSLSRADQVAMLKTIEENIQQRITKGATAEDAIHGELSGEFGSDVALYAIGARQSTSAATNDAAFMGQILATETQIEINQLQQEQSAIKNEAVNNIESALKEQGIELNTPEEKEFVENVFEQSAESQMCLMSYDGMEDVDPEKAQQIIFEAETEAAAKNGKDFHENSRKIGRLEEQLAEETSEVAATSETAEDLTLEAPSIDEMTNKAALANEARNYADQVGNHPINKADIEAYFGDDLSEADMKLVTDTLEQSGANLDNDVYEPTLENQPEPTPEEVAITNVAPPVQQVDVEDTIKPAAPGMGMSA